MPLQRPAVKKQVQALMIHRLFHLKQVHTFKTSNIFQIRLLGWTRGAGSTNQLSLLLCGSSAHI